MVAGLLHATTTSLEFRPTVETNSLIATMIAMWQSSDSKAFALAIQQAQKSFEEGGLPIGSTLVDGNGEIIGVGHNQRVQSADPTAHGEISCLRNAGLRSNYLDCTIFTTLAPCSMCTGAILLFKIPRVVVGEATAFKGDLDKLHEAGVEVIIMEDAQCIELMQRFMADNAETWKADIGEGTIAEPERGVHRDGIT